jgi:hypothetical protein
MKLKSKTYNSVIIEITKSELIESGFEKIWDEIREQYSASEYEIENFKENNEKTILYIELKIKKNFKILEN